MGLRLMLGLTSVVDVTQLQLFKQCCVSGFLSEQILCYYKPFRTNYITIKMCNYILKCVACVKREHKTIKWWCVRYLKSLSYECKNYY